VHLCTLSRAFLHALLALILITQYFSRIFLGGSVAPLSSGRFFRQICLRPAFEEQVPKPWRFFIQLHDLLGRNSLLLDQFMQFFIVEQLTTEPFGDLARDRKTVASEILA
jgi:hypothetical protein